MRKTNYLSSFQGTNDMEKIAAAMQWLKENPGAELIIEPGVYHFSTPLARKTMEDVIGGVYGRNPQPDMFTPTFPYSRGMVIDGQQGTKITANGVVLMIEGFMEPVSVINSSDVEICGLTIDHLRKPYSHGTIREIQPADEEGLRECIIEFDEDSPLSDSSAWELRILFFDTEKNCIVFSDEYRTPQPEGKQFIDSHHIRAKIRYGENLRDGCRYYTAHTLHSRPAILIENAKNITLTDVTVHNQPGMGVVGHRSENILLKHLSVVPVPGHHMSTNTDATHFTAIKGLLRFEDCVFQGNNDDCSNVHGYYHEVLSREGECTYITKDKAADGTHSQSLDYPDVGDTLELCHSTTFEKYGEFIVLDCKVREKERVCEITLDRPLPEDLTGLLLSDITRLPRLEVVGCTAHLHEANSFKIKNRDTLIENCTFQDIEGAAVIIAAEYAWWGESSTPANLVFRNNHIVNCGFGYWRKAPLFIRSDHDTAVKGCIRNITIENNTIECIRNDRPAIFAQVTDGLKISGNTILTPSDIAVHIENCDRVDLGTTDRKTVALVESVEGQLG